jgi:hypothetical protein
VLREPKCLGHILLGVGGRLGRRNDGHLFPGLPREAHARVGLQVKVLLAPDAHLALAHLEALAAGKARVDVAVLGGGVEWRKGLASVVSLEIFTERN